MATIKERFLDSLDRCSADPEFMAAFYRHFVERSEEIRAKFRYTDMAHQTGMLLASLRLVAGATQGEPDALQEVRKRAETHNRHNLNIDPDLYEHWQTAALQTAEQFDPQWNDAVREAWDTTLSHVVRQMRRFY